MDLSCIILSGDLELYVLGMLPGDEAAKIEQLALLFPEVQEELDRITGSLVELGNTAILSPAPTVKMELMEKLQAMHDAELKVAPVVPLQTGRYIIQPTEASTENESPVIAMQPAGKRNNWLAAASLIGLVLAVGGLFFLFTKNNQTQTEVAGLQKQVGTLTRNVVELQRDKTAALEMVNMLQSDVYRKIKLTEVPGKPDALVQLMWNTQTKEVFVGDVLLPQTPAGKQYQLWAIVDGKPVDAGMLSNVKNRVQLMKKFEKAEAFAITLEKEGGSPTPTMEAMYVMAGV